MKSDEIIDVLHKRYKAIRKHYNNILEDFSRNEIHDFRLETKRLRAFIRMVNTDIQGKKLGLGSAFKSFYHITGNIRNLQLHEQRICRVCKELGIENPRLYLKLLRNEEVRQRNKAREVAEWISLDHLEKNNIDAVPDKLKAGSIENFILQQEAALVGLLCIPVYYDEALHEIRKILKDLLYDWDYAEIYMQAVLPNYFASKKNIELLTARLGDFHDLCVALYFFSGIFMDQMVSETEVEILATVKEELISQKARLKHEIILLILTIRKELGKETLVTGAYEIV